MSRPPASPPSSDIEGVHRDEPATRARGKQPDADQQAQLAAVRPEDAARPLADPVVADSNFNEGNPQ